MFIQQQTKCLYNIKFLLPTLNKDFLNIFLSQNHKKDLQMNDMEICNADSQKKSRFDFAVWTVSIKIWIKCMYNGMKSFFLKYWLSQDLRNHPQLISFHVYLCVTAVYMLTYDILLLCFNDGTFYTKHETNSTLFNCYCPLNF